jgi:putative ABC transport system substrate-binding protein
MMRRRDFVALLSGATAWPLAAQAQQTKMARVGALYIGTADAEAFKKELREGLRELGYFEGQNIAFEFRSAEGKLDRLPELAAELAHLKVDVIVALYVPPSLAAKQATRDIPVVVIVGDPVETGIVASLARPGGNITGVSLMASALHGKSVELFRDMLPSVRRVGVLGHTTNPVFAKAMLDEVLLAGGPTGIEIKPVVMISGIDELDKAFSNLVSERADAVVIQGSLAIKPVTDMAIKYRMPSASTARAFAEIGGLMSFGADGPAAFRHGAKFAHRILQGRHPQDLPIEQPTKFELVINLKTAKANGLTIPEAFLLRADALLEWLRQWLLARRSSNETPPIPHAAGRRGGVAARCASAAVRQDADHRVSWRGDTFILE